MIIRQLVDPAVRRRTLAHHKKRHKATGKSKRLAISADILPVTWMRPAALSLNATKARGRRVGLRRHRVVYRDNNWINLVHLAE